MGCSIIAVLGKKRPSVAISVGHFHYPLSIEVPSGSSDDHDHHVPTQEVVQALATGFAQVATITAGGAVEVTHVV